jgi:hypothetical protein
MRPFFFTLFALIIFATQPTVAQTEDCPAFVQEALSRLDNTCQGLGRNSICYGNTLVSVTFNHEMDAEVFDSPSDQAELKDVQLVETAPLDEARQQWGLALMNVQANVPGTLPGQGVVFILMGDAQLRNEVDPALLPDASKAVSILTTVGANIRSAPSARANVLGSVGANTTLQADLRSPDGEWLRVVYNDLPAWINRSVIQESPEIDILPNPTRTELSPMQAFQFTGGIGSPTCKRAAGSLLIQGPDQVVVDLEANGARIRLASTILLTREEDKLRVTTLSGAAQVEDVIVPAGFTTQASVSEENVVVSAFEAVEEAELDELEIFEELPEDTLHYELDLEEAAQNQEEFDPEDLEFEDEFDFEDDENDSGSDDVDVCAIDASLPECSTDDNEDDGSDDVDVCAIDPTLPECSTDDNEDDGSDDVDVCAIDASLPECSTDDDNEDDGSDDVDVCAIDASLPECSTDDNEDDGSDDVDVCAIDASLPECSTNDDETDQP